MRVLVTAGNTRERIDDVRDWGNIFTGNTGFSIARALADVAEVDLLTSNTQHLDQIAEGLHTAHAVRGTRFVTHADLRAALANAMANRAYNAVMMSAAVSDYAPKGVYEVSERQTDPDGRTERWTVRNVSAGKVSSSFESIAVLGHRTEKLIDLFRTEWAFKGLLIKFKLQVGMAREELIRIGQASRKSSGADYLVANTLDMVHGTNAGAYLLSDHVEEWVPRADLPSRLKQLVIDSKTSPGF